MPFQTNNKYPSENSRIFLEKINADQSPVKAVKLIISWYFSSTNQHNTLNSNKRHEIY